MSKTINSFLNLISYKNEIETDFLSIFPFVYFIHFIIINILFFSK